MNDEGFREIQLNGKQLIFLFMAVTVVLVVTFLFGVLVGRGVREGGAPQIASSDIASDPGLVPASEQAGPPPAAGGAPAPRAARRGAQLRRPSPARFGSAGDAETRGTACSRTGHSGAGVSEGAGSASAGGSRRKSPRRHPHLLPHPATVHPLLSLPGLKMRQ